MMRRKVNEEISRRDEMKSEKFISANMFGERVDRLLIGIRLSSSLKKH